jgi:uncharacterized integral membrane protein
MNYVTGTLAVVLLIIVLVFSIQNREAVDISFLFWSMNVPKIFLILGTYVFGLLSAFGGAALVKRVLT